MLDSTNIYYIAGQSNYIQNIKKYDITNGVVTSLFSLVDATKLAVDASNIYTKTTSGTGSIYLSDKNTENLTPDLIDVYTTKEIYSDGTYVYWIDGPGTISRVDIATGTARTIATGLCNVQAIAIDHSDIFFTVSSSCGYVVGGSVNKLSL